MIIKVIILLTIIAILLGITKLTEIGIKKEKK